MRLSNQISFWAICIAGATTLAMSTRGGVANDSGTHKLQIFGAGRLVNE